ncbi:MAG TPA: guanylate kinase [Nitrospiraceae bacterium]|nr:guanylate kinase [Nitrospiraceae bacterium]
MQKKTKGKLFIISAPSGAGKTTLCQELSRITPNLKHSVSYTTRAARPGETNGVHYNFISERQFKKMVERDEFAEWAVVHGNLYGTTIADLEKMRKDGCDVILDIDTQGAAQIRRKFKDGIYIFILPPSMSVLEERLKNRMSDSDLEIKKRLERAKEEITRYPEYDFIVINDEFDKALDKLKSIVITKRIETENIDPAWIEENFYRR